MFVLAMAILLTGAGETQPAPEPQPGISIQFEPLTALPPWVRVIGLPPVVTSEPSPLPRTARPARRATANLAAYVSEDDYPVRALREHHEGRVAFRLDVDSAGRVANCTVTESSGSEALDGATCRIFRARPHFIPARMADGSAGADSVRGRIRWRLSEADGRAGVPVAATPALPLNRAAQTPTAANDPRGASPLPERGSLLRIAIGRAGRVIGCDVVGSSGSATLDDHACRLYITRARFAPARNQAGVAVCDVARVGVYWTVPVATGPRPGRSQRESLAARVPRALRGQLNAGLCPGWSRN